GRRGRQMPNREKIADLKKALMDADAGASAAMQHARQHNDDDVIYFFPRLDGAEMSSRWDMQDAPPDILITNYSMLSIMLMREADQNIFDKTKEWLTREDSVFHLIVDELHLYRGTAGTEVAYLLRLLLNRLGLTPNSHKLRILASSASLEPRDDKSRIFLSDFFGCDWSADQIITGSQQHLQPQVNAPPLPRLPFIKLAEARRDENESIAKEAYS